MIISRVTAAIALCFATSCTSLPATQSGALSTYSNLNAGRGKEAKQTFVDGAAMRSIRSIAISPTAIGAAVSNSVPKLADRVLVANAVDRAMCLALAEKFNLVDGHDGADLTVQATVSAIVPTGKTAAAISVVTTLGTSAVLPVGVPRLPIGLGGLAVEFEALDATGAQRAAMTWARGANSITNRARISEIGDAYSLASAAGRRFGQIIISSNANPGISLPSYERIATSMGRRSSSNFCNNFGKPTGIAGLAGSVIGAPPSWSDKGPSQRH